MTNGQTKAVDNIVDARFDQAYTYDHMGRMTSSESGLVTNSQDEEVPAYAQTIQYNPFGDMTLRGTGVWGNSAGFTATYLNGRKQNTDLIYDAAGNIVENPTINPNIYDKWKFDAAGRVVETVSRWYDGAPQQTSFDRTHEIEQAIDGDGQIIKRTETKTSVQIFPSNTHVEEKVEYFVRSSVLGGKISTEVKPDGTKKLTSVYAGKGIIAEQVIFPSGEKVSWRHEDLVTGSFQKVTQNGTPHQYGDPENAAEFEPLGGVIPDTDPNPEEPDVSPFPDYRWSSDIERPERGCSWDGTPVDCSMLSHILRGNQVSRIEVNTRDEGSWDAYYGLRGAYTIKKTSLVSSIGPACEDNGQCQGTTETAIRYHYELIESPIALQTGRAEALTDVENDKLDTRIDLLVNGKLKGDKCQALLAKLGTDAYTKLIDTLKNRGLRYSAERSTDITVEQAGLYGENARRVLTILSDKKHNKNSASRQDAQQKLDRLDLSVSEWRSRVSIHAVLGNIGGKKVIFYDSFKKITTIVHENLHISTGLGDVDLANALGLKDAKGNQFKEGDTYKASAAISQALIDKGCTN